MKPISKAQLIKADLRARCWKHPEEDLTKTGMDHIHALLKTIPLRVLAKEIA